MADTPGQVRVRFAPSPTGYLHIGGARTALFNAIYARQNQGVFVLRIEDTDRERSTDEAVQAILDAMAWLNLEHDGEIYYQTKRFDRYAEVIDWLLAEGKAYRCYSSAEEVEAMREAARAAGYADVVAPPTFPVVVQEHTLAQLLADEDAGIDFSRVVHGDQRFSYTRPVVAGDELRATMTVTSVRIISTARTSVNCPVLSQLKCCQALVGPTSL